MEPRDELVIQTVAFQDQGHSRPVLHRRSLSELVVPYGDPAPDWSIRNAFDEGEYEIGRFTNELIPGEDCPEHAVYLDVVMANDAGTPYTLRRGIGVFERDGGTLWKNPLSERTEGRRARELCVLSFATLGNYVYGFQWVFR